MNSSIVFFESELAVDVNYQADTYPNELTVTVLRVKSSDITHSFPNVLIPDNVDMIVNFAPTAGNIDYDFPIAIVIVLGKYDRSSLGNVKRLRKQYGSLAGNNGVPVIFIFQREGVNNRNSGPYIVDPSR